MNYNNYLTNLPRQQSIGLENRSSLEACFRLINWTEDSLRRNVRPRVYQLLPTIHAGVMVNGMSKRTTLSKPSGYPHYVSYKRDEESDMELDDFELTASDSKSISVFMYKIGVVFI